MMFPPKSRDPGRLPTPICFLPFLNEKKTVFEADQFVCVEDIDLESFTITPEDLRKKHFKQPGTTLIVFVVDASDSMGQGTYVRMKAAKGAVLALLTKARLRRHRIAMVAFGGRSAQIVLPPPTSLALAQRQLNSLPTGGATPFAHGLMTAWQIIQSERFKDPSVKPLMVVLSDGEANAPYDGDRQGVDVMTELHRIAGRMGRDHIHAIVIDTLPRWETAHPMRGIARFLGGAYHHVDRLGAAMVVEAIDGAVAGPRQPAP